MAAKRILIASALCASMALAFASPILRAEEPVRRFAKPVAKKNEGPRASFVPADTSSKAKPLARQLTWRSPKFASKRPFSLASNSRKSEGPQLAPATWSESSEDESGASEPAQDPFQDPFGDNEANAPADLEGAQDEDESAIEDDEETTDEEMMDEETVEEESGDALEEAIELVQDGAEELPLGDEQNLDNQLAQKPVTDLPPCKTLKDFKSMRDITTNITAAKGIIPPECLIDGRPYAPRMFAMSPYYWKASGLCHKPLYFEQRALERYGHSWGPVVQPAMSAAHFFGSVAVLPYKMGVHPPGECLYDLGHYRPGSCAPKMWYTPPISLRGAAYEATAVSGLIFLLP